MTIPDANLILYAHNAADPDHDAARAWWTELMTGGARVGIPMVVVLAFLRLATSPRVLQDPLDVQQAGERVLSWFAAPTVHLIHPRPDHPRLLIGLLHQSGCSGNLTTDAHLAALAIEYNAELHSNDQDFGRFPGLRWKNPLKDRP